MFIVYNCFLNCCKCATFSQKYFKWELLVLVMMSASALTTELSPCRVHNVLQQPRLGISARNKKLINVVQIPPVFTQNVVVSICLDGGHKDTSGLPDYICKQRYTFIEVYSKLAGLLPSLPIASNVSTGSSKELLSLGFYKELVIIEAGCDFIMYPERISKSRQDHSRKLLLNPEILGVAALLDSTAYPKVFLTGSLIKATLPAELEEPKIAPRSAIQSNFFKSGLHINSTIPVVLNEGIADARDEEKVKNHGSPFSKTTTGPLGLTVTSDETEDIPDGDFPLNPSDIGLPILILDPALDPVMIIVSSYKA